MSAPLHKFALLRGDIPRDYDTLAMQWRQVSEVFDDGAHCRSCPYKYTWHEGHGEHLRGCDILDRDDRLSPEDCPALSKPCLACKGRGEMWRREYGGEEWSEPCEHCNGSGRER